MTGLEALDRLVSYTSSTAELLRDTEDELTIDPTARLENEVSYLERVREIERLAAIIKQHLK